jgi:type IV pilus assembly protein PilE
MFTKKLNAFTLAEVLVVLAIIGILVLIALPRLMPLISQAKSVEAKQHLHAVYTFETTFFQMHSKYSASLPEIGYEPSKSTKEGGQANYKIEIVSATATAFKAQARAEVDFDGDGNFNLWEIDQENNLKEVTPD